MIWFEGRCSVKIPMGVSRGQFQRYLTPDPSLQGDQHLEAKPLPLASHQVGYTRLSDPQSLSRLALRHPAGFNIPAQVTHQVGPHLKNRRFIRLKSKIDEHVAARFRDSGIHHLILNLSVRLPSKVDIFGV